MTVATPVSVYRDNYITPTDRRYRRRHSVDTVSHTYYTKADTRQNSPQQQEATHRIAALRGNKQQEAIIFDDTAIVVDIEFYIKAPKNHFVKAAGGVCNNQLR